MPPDFRFQDGDELDGCGPNAVLAELGRLLFVAIIHVYALPNWPVRQLITTTIAFAGSALISRLPAFHTSNPGIDIRVIESDECLDLDRHEIDLAIRYGEQLFIHRGPYSSSDN
jgi:DNA-binding transcriptional LysR family regulator